MHHSKVGGAALDLLGDSGQFFARQPHPVTIVRRLVCLPGRSLDATVGLAGGRPPGRLGFSRQILRLFVGGVEAGSQVRGNLFGLGSVAALGEQALDDRGAIGAQAHQAKHERSALVCRQAGKALRVQDVGQDGWQAIVPSVLVGAVWQRDG